MNEASAELLKRNYPDEIVRQLEATSASPRLRLNDLFVGDEMQPVRDALIATGEFANAKNHKTLHVQTMPSGDPTNPEIVALATVSRDPGRTQDYIDTLADFRVRTSVNRVNLIRQYWEIYRSEGIVNNAINKYASLLSVGGRFKVRSVKKGKQQKATEVAQQVLDYWVRHVNAPSEQGVATSSRGLKAVTEQGIRVALVEGDFMGREAWQPTTVGALGTFSLPMTIQTLSMEFMTPVAGLQGLGELWYWTPNSDLVKLIKGDLSNQPKEVKQIVKRLFDSDIAKQIKKDGKALLNPALLVHVKHRGSDRDVYGECYDASTEILTQRGWLPFSELTKTDSVATRSPSGVFEWQIPTDVVSYAYAGPMYAFTSRSVDLLVTPNHRMLITGTSRALGLTGATGEERIVTAEALAKHASRHVKIPQTSSWIGEEVPEQLLASNSRYDLPGTVVGGDDYCALLGAYLAEGNLRTQGGIEVNQFRTSDAWEMYNELIVTRLGGGFSYQAATDSAPQRGRFTLSKRAYSDHLSQVGHCAHEKVIPGIIMNATPRQLKIFWDFFIAGDGTRWQPSERQRGDQPQMREKLTTTSRRLADQMVEIAQKLGWSASLGVRPAGKRRVFGVERNCRETYQVVCRYSTAMKVAAEKVNYTGSTHCVQVPNGVVYVRRNGRPAWCGNSFIEPAKLGIRYSRAVTNTDMVSMENVINRLMIVMVGSSDPKSPYSKTDVAMARTSLMQSFFEDISPNMTVVWSGDDVKVESHGAMDTVMDLNERHKIGERKIVIALGIPGALLDGSASDGKAAGWASLIAASGMAEHLGGAFATSWMILGERILLENNFTDIDITFEYDRTNLADKELERNQNRNDYSVGLNSIFDTVLAQGRDPDAVYNRRCFEQGLEPGVATWKEVFSAPQGLPGQGAPGAVGPDGNAAPPPGQGPGKTPGTGKTPASVTGKPAPTPKEKKTPVEHK